MWWSVQRIQPSAQLGYGRHAATPLKAGSRKGRAPGFAVGIPSQQRA
jgi:hypothetical protein